MRTRITGVLYRNMGTSKAFRNCIRKVEVPENCFKRNVMHLHYILVQEQTYYEALLNYR